MNECGAKTRSGGTCKRAPTSNGRCNLHGGRAGRPVVHGRYSKHLPQRLASRYEEALADPDLIAQRDEIATIDARISELLSRLDSTETSLGWKLAWKLRQAEKAGGPEGMKAGLQLDTILESGLKDSATWEEVAGFIEQRRRCADTEQKRLAALDQFVTAKQANVLVAAIIRLVSENVPDADARSRIAQGLVALVGGADQPGANAAAVH